MADTAGRALYLAWRPRRFDDVVGQGHVVRTIRNAVRNGTIAHAYLFSGPRGTGKTTMARLLFKAVNCLQPIDGGPCETCTICTSANAGRALDLIELDAASNRGIDDVRDLRDKINYAPAEARYRVYILDEAHQLTQAAWDALLKTLEEPPPHAILVLATTESHKVPATVLSRCQRFDFHRHTAADIRDRLARIAREEGVEIEPAVLSWLARASRGGMRDAISLLDQLRTFCGDRVDAESARDVLGLAGLETVRPFLEALQDERTGEALEELNDALERGTDLRVYVGDTLTYLRGLLLLRYGAVGPLRAELPDEELAWLEECATAWEADRLRQLVGGFGDALARFRDPAQLLIQVELALLGGWQATGSADTSSRGRAAGGSVFRERPAPPISFTPARDAGRRGGAEGPSGGTARPRPGAPPSPAATPVQAQPPSTLSAAPAPTGMRSAPAPVVPPPGELGAGGTPRGASDPSAMPVPAASAAPPVAPRPAGGASSGGPPPDWPDYEPPAYEDPYGEGSVSAGPAARRAPTSPAAPPPPAPAPMAPTPAPPPAAAQTVREAPGAGAARDPGSQAVGGNKWDGLGVGGTTVRAHWETDEDDDADVVRVTVAPPPPPPPPRSASAGPAANGSPASTPTTAAAEPDLELAEMRRRWPSIRDAIWSNPIDRASFQTAELVGIEGRTLVVQMSAGLLKLLKDEKRRAIRGELIGLLGRGADIRFIDDRTPYAPPAAGPARAGAVQAAPPAAVMPTTDPVIQAGLRLFGGPLERLPDD